jgi:predicted nuclease of restriction endonuclease-like (RecB) superfamily
MSYQLSTNKFLSLLFTLIVSGSLVGQTLPGSSSIKTITYYTTVKDSVEKLVNKSNSIVIEMCNGYSEIILTKNSKNWQGFYIKSLFREGIHRHLLHISKTALHTHKSQCKLKL